MESRMIFVFAILGMLAANALEAQEELPKNWNTEKIRGNRFLPEAAYLGTPLMFDKFLNGEIKMEDGTLLGNLQLNYNNYRDELVYYNSAISTQIVVDKMSICSFSLTDEKGIIHLFRKQTYDGPMPGDRYFEVLSEGDTALLVYRKVLLLACTIYGEVGKEKNMSYQDAFSYYFYNVRRGYVPVKPEKKSFLSKFDTPDQKMVRKLLQQNKVSVSDEISLVKGWNLIKGNGLAVHL